MENIYILLPVYNRHEITRRFLRCLKRQTYANYHLVLIDDGSIDGTEEMARGEIKSITVIKGTGNWWWAGSLQKGYEWLKARKVAGDDVVLIINDDTEFEEDFFLKALKLMKGIKRTLLLAHCYSRQDGRLLDAGVHVDWRRLSFHPAVSTEQINCLSTRGLFLEAADFFETGGFYPRLLPHYGSDYEFSMRARRMGMKLMTDPALRVWLDEDATGYHTLDSCSLYSSLGKIFARKSTMNPVAWTIFIGLSCPWRWKIQNWFRVWIRAFHSLYLSCRQVSTRI